MTIGLALLALGLLLLWAALEGRDPLEIVGGFFR